jgi:hypothetical protein
MVAVLVAGKVESMANVLGAIEAELMVDYLGNKYIAMSVDKKVVVRVETRVA